MDQPIRGAGDVVAKVTKFLGVQPCEACKARQEKWNKMFPIRFKNKIREMTEKELSDWKAFQAVRTLKLTPEQAKFVCTIYSEVFKVPYFEPCSSCDASPYILMIERMDSITKTYNETE